MRLWGGGRSDGPRPAQAPSGACLLIISFVFTIACALWPGPVAAQTYSFGSIVVEGNERIETGTVLSYAGIATGSAVSAAELNDAYQRVLGSGLFETVELVPDGGTLRIRVSEFPTVNQIAFEGNRRLEDDALRGLIGSQERRVYSPDQAEADAAAISAAYLQAGRLAATVDPRIIRRSENRVDLVFEIREGVVAEIERITFQGNRAFSDSRLRRVLDTKQAGVLRQFIQRDTFIADRIEFDKQLLRDFYAARGYIDFQVLAATAEVTRERDGFFVTFTVREGQQFRVGEITTTSTLAEIDPEEFHDVINIRDNAVYSPTLVETTISRMENLALLKGLRFIRVEPRITRNDRDLTLDIEFAVERGPRVFVERIDIEGNAETLDRVIRRQFRTVEGDPFNPREIRAAARRIEALGFFANTEVTSAPGSSDDQVLIDVNVEEQPTGSLTFGLSFSATTGAGIAASFSEANFLGRGQFLGVSVNTTSSNGETALTFREPGFLGRDLAFGVSARYRESESGSTNNTTYDTRIASFSPSIGFPITENGRLQLRYTYADEKVSNIDPGASFLIQSDAGALATSEIGYSYSYDTRSTGLNPTAGILFRFSQDFAGLGGDNEYIRSEALIVAERRVRNEEILLRAAFEAGGLTMLNGNSRVIDRYFGNGKIRGFEPNGIGPRDFNAAQEDALGGNYFAVARFEAEFPLPLPEEYGVSGGLFLDIGSVWSLDNILGGPTGTDPVDDGFDLRSAVGFSVFWTTPLGPLRFNFSQPLLKQTGDLVQNFDLTVSTQF